MLNQTDDLHRHFYAYYQSNTLVIQFVMTEFLETYQLSSEIKNLTDECLISLDALKKSVDPLFQHFNRLLGSTSDHGLFSVSRWTRGPLTKLKDYCEQLSQNSQHQNSKNFNLHTHVHQAWLNGLRNLELLHILQQPLMVPLQPTLFSTLKRTLKQFNQLLKKVAHYLLSAIEPYRQDENVLFFLFRKKERLETIYETSSLDKLFKPLRKGKTQQALSQFLIQKYESRGFFHLIPLSLTRIC